MSIEMIVEAIHASPVRLSLCICGAGAGVIRHLTRVSGCSRTLLEADILYHRGSTQAALDGLPHKVVSADVARQLAQHAFHMSRAITSAEMRGPLHSPTPELSEGASSVLFGVGATSAIKTNRSRHGKDEAYVSVWGGAVSMPGSASPSSRSSSAMLGQVRDYYMVLPDWMSRAEQDEQVELMLLHAISRTIEPYITTDAGSGGTGTDAAFRHVYPCPLFRPRPPTVGERDAFPNPGADTSSPLPGRSVAEGSAPLCSMPLESPPAPVCLDLFGEVRLAVLNVLNGGGSVKESGSSVRDVCALWNRHGELRCRGVAPYLEDMCFVSEGVTNDQEGGRHGQHPSPTASADVIRLLYPGSFNPLHYGHTEMAQAARRVLLQRQEKTLVQTALSTSVELTYEIAVNVADKGAIEVDDLVGRVYQFLRRGERVAVTAASLFIEKARLFPGHGFLIGVDTATRVLDRKYYSSHKDPAEAEAAMVTALIRDIGGRGCFFVVGGRNINDAAGWQDMSTLRVPESIQHLFIGIPSTEFRVDVSSTELRARRSSPAA